MLTGGGGGVIVMRINLIHFGLELLEKTVTF